MTLVGKIVNNGGIGAKSPPYKVAGLEIMNSTRVERPLFKELINHRRTSSRTHSHTHLTTTLRKHCLIPKLSQFTVLSFSAASFSRRKYPCEVFFASTPQTSCFAPFSEQ